MTTSATTTYDKILYPGHSLAQAHPDRLATIAKLFGMTPADVSRCRVLELGCGDGLNLISVALGLPESECVGIDLAAAGIQRGLGVTRELGLKNISLRQADILDVGSDFGNFDFIIAHGIYSWVPEKVRDKLLGICKENLAENGVAYVSYNVYPGGHFRDLVREMMRYHVGEFEDPHERVRQARALIKFIIDAGTEPDLYRMVLQKELERITEFTDSSLFHDDLSEHNAPVYFYQFVEHAKRHGLKYLSEAQFPEIQAGIFPANAVEVLNRISDSAIAKEQYLDFLKCRRFRQTLLCHNDRQLDDIPRPEKAAAFYVASPVRTGEPDLKLHSRERITFIGPKSSSIATDNPLIKVAMRSLGEVWPQAIHFSDLLTRARQTCGNGSAVENDGLAEDIRTLGNMLLRAYAGGVVEFHIYPPRFVTHASERPLASPLARLQSRDGGDVINLCHYNIRVADPLSRELLSLLDGSRDRAALLNQLVALVESGVATVEKSDGSTKNPDGVREFLGIELERKLAEIAEMALLVA